MKTEIARRLEGEVGSSSDQNLKLLVAHLKEANQHYREFLANISHELKGPLTILSGYAELLLDRFANTPLPEELRDGLWTIGQNTARLQGLVEELFDAIRIENHKIQLNKEPLPAAELLAQMVKDHRLQAQDRNIRLSHNCLGLDPPYIMADAQRLRQILGNLLSNALKFTPTGGAIDVEARAQGEWILFSVRDTGIGMDAQQCARIFERYYQAPSEAEYTRGLGLGLEITKGLVELHGGRIWVESSPGKGSRFFFLVPSTVVKPDPGSHSSPPLTAIRYSKR